MTSSLKAGVSMTLLKISVFLAIFRRKFKLEYYVMDQELFIDFNY
jgi:hypothetical protein